MRTTISRLSKLEVVKRGQELEKEGWECVQPIRKSTDSFKEYRYGDGLKDSVNLNEKWFAVYERNR